MNISGIIRLDSETSNTLVYMHSYGNYTFSYMVLTYGYLFMELGQ